MYIKLVIFLRVSKRKADRPTEQVSYTLDAHLYRAPAVYLR